MPRNMSSNHITFGKSWRALSHYSDLTLCSYWLQCLRQRHVAVVIQSPETHWPTYVTMIIADVLLPIRPQAIGNYHHADGCMTTDVFWMCVSFSLHMCALVSIIIPARKTTKKGLCCHAIHKVLEPGHIFTKATVLLQWSPLNFRTIDDSKYAHAVLALERIYRKTSNIRRTWVSNKIVDHSYVVGASPVGAAPTTSSFWT